MKKNGILNSHIANVLSQMRHTDQIVIGDAGLPVPNDVIEIDIALSLGKPSFIEVLDEILKDMEVERIFLAEEIKNHNKNQYRAINNLVRLPGENIKFINHEDFKELTTSAKAIIRTGEATPYSNVILQAGVIF